MTALVCAIFAGITTTLFAAILEYGGCCQRDGAVPAELPVNIITVLDNNGQGLGRMTDTLSWEIVAWSRLTTLLSFENKIII